MWQCGSFRGWGARSSRKCRDTKQANADVSASRGRSARSRQLDRFDDRAATKKEALAIWACRASTCLLLVWCWIVGQRPLESRSSIERASVKKVWRWIFFRSGAGLFSCAWWRDDVVTAEVLSLTSSWPPFLRVLRRALHALQSRTARVSCAVSRVSCSSRVCSCHQQCVFYVWVRVPLCRIRLFLLGDHCDARGGNSRDHTCLCNHSFTL